MGREIPRAEIQLCLAAKNIGATTEYISDLTGARLTGIDLAAPVIARAAERTREKADRLSFSVANINRLDLPPESFDAVISIDTLYFARDLAATIGQLKAARTRRGQMGIFYSEVVTSIDGSRETPASDRTKLAEALKANGMAFTSEDLTDANLTFWQRSQDVISEVKPEFEADGAPELCEGRIIEGDSVLALAKAGRTSRDLCHARV
jgi:SAM-dependent methyltransferase